MLYMTNERYESARKIYQSIGVDTEAALERLKNVPVSMHCWQGDDVIGFDSRESLSGGIQTTGNYPGRAATPEQLMEDISIDTCTWKEEAKPSCQLCHYR